MTNPWRDLDRPPLRERDLIRHLTRSGSEVSVRVVQSTGSTNADLAAAARNGAAEGQVLLAEEQTAGKGRLDRGWTAPAHSGLTFSVLLRPDPVPVTRWGWLPLLVGVSVAEALREVAEVDVCLKWPNDLHIDGRKLGGILVERVDAVDEAGSAAIVGIGLNVTLREDELPVPTATSLLLAGAASSDRLLIFRAAIRHLFSRYEGWRAASGDPEGSGLREAYVELSATIGSRVRVELPGGRQIIGPATGLDPSGALRLDTADGELTVAAGDIVHLRPAEAAG